MKVLKIFNIIQNHTKWTFITGNSNLYTKQSKFLLFVSIFTSDRWLQTLCMQLGVLTIVQ